MSSEVYRIKEELRRKEEEPSLNSYDPNVMLLFYIVSWRDSIERQLKRERLCPLKCIDLKRN